MKAPNSVKVGATDLLMLLTCVFWAINFSVVKIALREFPPHAFNASRLVAASALLLIYLWRKEGGLAVGGADLLRLAALGLVGNTIYQIFFINGISLTSASTTSLIMTMSPVLIALLSALLGAEKIRWAGWAGILVAFLGLFLIFFGHPGRLPFGGENIRGDLFILAGNVCWAAYTVFSRPLLTRMSPLKLTTLTLALGAIFYLPVAVKELASTPWSSLSATSWSALAYSALFSFAAGYLIWYSSVKRVGNTKTGIYGYITPVFSMLFAHLLLGEGFHLFQVLGFLVIFFGFYLTRFGDRWISANKEGA